MTDVMTAVYDFIKAYAYDPDDADIPQYADDQIIRAGLTSPPRRKLIQRCAL